MKVVNVLQVSALVSSSDDIKIRDGVTKNDDDDAFWRPKDERFPERNATRRRKSRQREKKRKRERKEKKQESRALFGKEEDDAVPFFPIISPMVCVLRQKIK